VGKGRKKLSLPFKFLLFDPEAEEAEARLKSQRQAHSLQAAIVWLSQSGKSSFFSGRRQSFFIYFSPKKKERGLRLWL